MYAHERSLVARLADKPFALIGVNSDNNRDALKPILEKEKITWRSFWNGPGGPNGPISNAWRINGWPTLFLIDHTGVIRQKWSPSPGNAAMDRAIDDLVKQAQPVSVRPESDERMRHAIRPDVSDRFTVAMDRRWDNATVTLPNRSVRLRAESK